MIRQSTWPLHVRVDLLDDDTPSSRYKPTPGWCF